MPPFRDKALAPVETVVEVRLHGDTARYLVIVDGRCVGSYRDEDQAAVIAASHKGKKR